MSEKLRGMILALGEEEGKPRGEQEPAQDGGAAACSGERLAATGFSVLGTAGRSWWQVSEVAGPHLGR